MTDREGLSVELLDDGLALRHRIVPESGSRVALQIFSDVGEVDVEVLQDLTHHRVGAAHQRDCQMTDSDEVGFGQVGRDLEAPFRSRREREFAGRQEPSTALCAALL